jgi:hypothetical protein
VRVPQGRVKAGDEIKPRVGPMKQPDDLPEELKDLIDDYLSGLLGEARLQALEDELRADATARSYFVRYARMHTDLHQKKSGPCPPLLQLFGWNADASGPITAPA